MKSARFLFALAAVASVASAQAFFECQTVGAIAGPDCEGITGSNASIVTSSCAALMPSEGLQCLRVSAAQGTPSLSTAQNTTISRPLASGAAEARIPVPAGTTGLSLDYMWNNEEGGSAQWVDGFDISLCDAAGNRILLVARGDTATNIGCSGLQSVGVTFPATVGGEYISCVAHNGGDTCCGGTYLTVDNVQLVTVAQFTLGFTSPLGNGSLQIDLANGAAGGLYFMGVSFAQGAFPNGPFFGIELSLFDVVTQFNAGPPFIGFLDGSGAFSLGPFTGLPSGLTFYAVALDNILSTGAVASAPVAYQIP